jgi:catechol 2,3-dioxygenase
MKNDPERSPEVGIAPPNFRLPPATRLGPVRFQISDLQRSVAFYRDLIGLQELERSIGGAVLGLRGEDRGLIELIEHAGARPARPGRRLGIYHVAILLPDRSDLGRFVRHATEAGIRLGMADHLVSEAVYLSDVDGLGLEVYADRPRESWRQKGAEVRMATDPLDVRSLVEAAGSEPWTGIPPGTTIGHVHLHVGRLDRASSFYHDAMGFDKVAWSYPGALFLSAGGYHHHLGTNEWAQGASAAGEDDARLLEWSIVLPTRADVEAARQSMGMAGYATTEHADAWSAADPWGTVVRVRQ